MRDATEAGRGTLGLALGILEQVARQRHPISAAEIARLVDAPRASVYRVLNSLVRDEYLVRRPDFTGFMLGTRVIELAAVVDEHQLSPVQAILDDVRRVTGEAVHLLGFTALGVTVWEQDARAPISDPQTLTADPTLSAAGHLWLAERFRDRPAPRAAFGRSAAQLEAITAAVSARGYGEQAGLLSRERGCLAVPVSSRDNVTVAAVALSIPLAEVAVAARHLSALRAAAGRLSDAGVLPQPA